MLIINFIIIYVKKVIIMKFNLHMLIHVCYAASINEIEIDININNSHIIKHKI